MKIAKGRMLEILASLEGARQPQPATQDEGHVIQMLAGLLAAEDGVAVQASEVTFQLASLDEDPLQLDLLRGRASSIALATQRLLAQPGTKVLAKARAAFVYVEAGKDAKQGDLEAGLEAIYARMGSGNVVLGLSASGAAGMQPVISLLVM